MRPLLETLSGIFSGRKVSDNVGATPPKPRGVGEQGGRRGQGESTGRTVGAPAETVASAGSRKATTAIVGAVPEFLTKRYAVEIGRATVQASTAAQRNDRPTGVVLAEQAKNIFRGFPKREVSAGTQKKYLAAYQRMLDTGRTPLEMANTRQAFDFYRSAWRFGLLRDIEALGRASEKARKAGNLDSAKRRTTRQFQMAIALEASTADTWAPKAKALKREGKTVKSKSKNPSKGGPRTPQRGFALAPLLTNGGRQTRVIERHATRLAILEATGLRPAELVKGVRLSATKKRGKKGVLSVMVEGAKWDGQNKGQQARVVLFSPSTVSEKALFDMAMEKGGQFVFTSTPADIRSLNRALAKGVDGLSCYSYRHAFGGALKKACLAGEMTREEAAEAMGHRSTASLSYYGQPSKSGGRRLRAKATDEVRNPAKPMNKVAMGKEKPITFPARPPRTTVSTRPAMAKPVGPLAGGPRMKR